MRRIATAVLGPTCHLYEKGSDLVPSYDDTAIKRPRNGTDQSYSRYGDPSMLKTAKHARVRLQTNSGLVEY